MRRTIGLAATVLAAGALLVGCSSDDDSKDNTSSDSSSASTTTDTSSGGGTVVKVDGSDLDGLDLDSVSCMKRAGKITIGSTATADGKEALGVVMSDGNPPKVDTFGIVYDGSALAVAPGVGSAEVKVDGDEYTITGTAAGADMANPTAGMLEKDFEIVVTCK
ncbi:lipoprotein LpqH [Gordonia humi]|uniref:Lipoprotein LpqH n=1 Tax=Gordonia humi TaxID=686429 RepID=A0A840ESX3_9ACTN|nr:lipoprotein LpqH [Gordonia humi]MBB4135985.1 lipoprotein LpqH [Gordonia humi]